MKINEYIESGILEAYITGEASKSATRKFLKLKDKHPEIQEALFNLEVRIEQAAVEMGVDPPDGMLSKIEGRINELIKTPADDHALVTELFENPHFKARENNQFLEISTLLRVKKEWLWWFISALLIVFTILATAIYLYVKDSRDVQQLDKLKMELKQQKRS